MRNAPFRKFKENLLPAKKSAVFRFLLHTYLLYLYYIKKNAVFHFKIIVHIIFCKHFLQLIFVKENFVFRFHACPVSAK